MTCHPEWRCLRIGCTRCDRERQRDADRKRIPRDSINSYYFVDLEIERRFRDPTIGERRRERNALRRLQEQERERREADPSVN